MTFLYPMMLWALALPLLLAVLAVLKLHHTSKAWRLLVSPNHEAALVVKTPAWRSTLPIVLTLAALTIGIIATARPIHGYTSTEAVSSGRNLLIALDISRSMETQDVKPSRLEEARAAAFELVEALPSDKIGLIVFSGEADLVVPLTYDHTALRDALEQVNRGWAGYGGTNFGLVLKKAMQDFARNAPTGTNALVIFSDGEDTVGSSLDIAREAREKHLLVITVGVGTSVGDSIPDARGENGLYQDASGKHVISKLDTAALQRFAEATGGDYFTMGSGADLTAFAREAVKKLDTHEETFSGHKVPRDLFAPFAITALVLLVAAILLGTEWRSPRTAAPLLLLLAVVSAHPLAAAPEAEAIRAYEEALSRMGEDDDKAREGFSRALLDDDTGIQAACLYELGNLNATATFNKLRDLYGQHAAPETTDEEAESDSPTPHSPSAPPSPEQLQEIVDELGKGLQPYRDALSIRPSMEPARINIRNIEQFIETLQEEIERLKQQQQNQPQNQAQNQQQDKSDDQQQDKPDDQQDKPDDQQQDKPEGQQQDKPEGQQQDKPHEQQQDQSEGQQQDKPDDQQQDKPEDQQQDQSEGQQQDKPDDQQQDKPGDKPQHQQPRPHPSTANERPLSDKEKSEQRASSILRMHMDEEQGSPIPHPNNTVRPPEKDY